MRVLMLGWEFPPFISGGLGTACQGLATAMSRRNVEVLFVLPESTADHVGDVSSEQPSNRLGQGSSVSISRVTPPLQFKRVPGAVPNPYGSWDQDTPRRRAKDQPDNPPFSSRLAAGSSSLQVIGAGVEGGYSGDMTAKIGGYARRCMDLTRHESFDVVHAHDWITFPAGMAIAARSGKPLIVHVHATEFDRCGEQIHPPIYNLEHAGMKAARKVIAVSQRTRGMIVEKYGLAPDKVAVIYNGIDFDPYRLERRPTRHPQNVLFLGRITWQKGPEYFLAAAGQVLEKAPDTRFTMAGWGDLAPQMTARTAAMGLSEYISFPGFLRGAQVDREFRAADVYVMPSVSEPFGLSALEAARNGIPVIVSKTSGVAEVLPRGSLKVDYWDVEAMARSILTVLERPEVAWQLRRHAAAEAAQLSWDQAARQCVEVYQQVKST